MGADVRPHGRTGQAAAVTDLAAAAALLYGARWQAPLARAIGVSRRTIVNWSNGLGGPGKNHWRAIAALLSARAKAADRLAGQLEDAA